MPARTLKLFSPQYTQKRQTSTAKSQVPSARCAYFEYFCHPLNILCWKGICDMVKKFFLSSCCALFCAYLSQKTVLISFLSVRTAKETTISNGGLRRDLSRRCRGRHGCDIETYEQDLHISWTNILVFSCGKIRRRLFFLSFL